MDSTNLSAFNGKPPEFPLELRNELVNVFKLLADHTRLYILFYLLQGDELNVTELGNLLEGQSQPQVSHHLLLLKGAGLLNTRKEGRNHYYSVNCDNMCEVITSLFQFICNKETQELRFKDFLMTKVDGQLDSEDAASSTL